MHALIILLSDGLSHPQKGILCISIASFDNVPSIYERESRLKQLKSQRFNCAEEANDNMWVVQQMSV
jgi:hypothetical protein